jgi:hypothetical protein
MDMGDLVRAKYVGGTLRIFVSFHEKRRARRAAQKS